MSMKGYAVKVRRLPTNENYEKLKSLKDDDLKVALCKQILECCDSPEKKEEINEILRHFWDFSDMVDEFIRLSELEIQKLERIRKGIFPYMCKAGVSKLDEIVAKLKNKQHQSSSSQ